MEKRRQDSSTSIIYKATELQNYDGKALYIKQEEYIPTREVDLHRQAPSNRVRALKEGTATLRKLEIFTCKLFPTFVHIVLCKSNCCKILDV